MTQATPVEKWLTALRTGSYAQEHEKLQNGDAFCAMGLLFHLHGYLDHNGKLLRKRGKNAVVETRLEALAVLQKLGVPLVLADRVVEMNDIAKKPFSEIADFIQQRMGEYNA